MPTNPWDYASEREIEEALDDDCGYELDDPKHPTFLERYADYADLMRKREKEDGP